MHMQTLLENALQRTEIIGEKQNFLGSELLNCRVDEFDGFYFVRQLDSSITHQNKKKTDSPACLSQKYIKP